MGRGPCWIHTVPWVQRLPAHDGMTSRVTCTVVAFLDLVRHGADQVLRRSSDPGGEMRIGWQNARAAGHPLLLLPVGGGSDGKIES